MPQKKKTLKPDSLSQHEAFTAKPQARRAFVDRCYHLPFPSRAELAEAVGDTWPSAYLIPPLGLGDDARAGRGPQILGSCQSRSSLKCNQYHQAPLQPNFRKKADKFVWCKKEETVYIRKRERKTSKHINQCTSRPLFYLLYGVSS